MACNRQEVGLSELIVSPGLKAYECMNKSGEYLFSAPACKIMVQQEGREITKGQWARHCHEEGDEGGSGSAALEKPKSHR